MSADTQSPRRATRHVLLTVIFVGGAAGAVSRGGLLQLWPAGGGWPWGTFAANLAGTAVLAVLALTFTIGNDPHRWWRGLLGTGFCGALTTFSALQVDTIRLAKDGRPGLAVAYAAASLIGGLAVAIGIGAGLRRARFG
jgi:CrcB protein